MKDKTSALITVIVILVVTITLLFLMILDIPTTINFAYLLAFWILIVSLIFPSRMINMKKENIKKEQERKTHDKQ